MLVLGVGNILLRDEGIGVFIVRELEKRDLPPEVELFDGGTAGMELLNVVADRKKVIVVDAVKGGDEPGTLYRFTPGDVTEERQLNASVHQVGLLEIIEMTDYLNCKPGKVVIIGVEPGRMEWGMELSPEIAGVVPRVIKLVMEEISKNEDSDR